MKSLIFKACSAVILILLASQGANAGDIVVISNSEIAVSADEIRDVFLGEKQFAGDTKLVVIDNAAIQSDFLSKIMHMDAAKYNGIWTKKSFRDGLTPPAVKSSDAEVIEYIKRTPGAIGYVSATPAVKPGGAETIEYIKRAPGAIGYISITPAGVKVIK